jgi:hypothetical protein
MCDGCSKLKVKYLTTRTGTQYPLKPEPLKPEQLNVIFLCNFLQRARSARSVIFSSVNPVPNAQENLLKYVISFKLKQLFNRHVLKLPPCCDMIELATQQAHHKMINFNLLEHLYQRSICDPALEVLDEVPCSNSVKPLEDSLGTLKITTAFRALEEANKHSQFIMELQNGSLTLSLL